MSASNKREAREDAMKVVKAWSIGISSAAWIPASTIMNVGGEIRMVKEIGSIFGVELDKEEAANLLATVTQPLMGRSVAGSILDFIPIIGWAIKPFIANEVTLKIGEALIEHFNNCSDLPE